MSGSSAKYKNTILYLCNQLGGNVRGKKKLAKLLYYVDFDRYEYKESAKTVTGDTYEAWRMGPVPTHYTKVVDELQAEGLIECALVESGPGYSPTEVFTASAAPDTDVFDKDDMAILNHVVQRYGGLTGKQLEELTHAEAPFVATEQSKEIPFDLAFYRGTDFTDVMATA